MARGLACFAFACAAVACGAATDPVTILVPAADASSTTYEVLEGPAPTADSGGADAADAFAGDSLDGSLDGLAATEGGDATGVSSSSSGGGSGVEAGVCTPITVMGVPSTGGAACTASGTTCYPHAETSFASTWVPPQPRSSLCTDDQIQSFYSACLGSTASDSACGSFTGASVNAACLGCLKTASTASAYGVLIQFPGNVVELNVAGCVALAEPCNLPCAKTWLASIECREAACTSTNCPDQGDQITCAMTAAGCSACQAYASAAACMDSLTGPLHPAGAVCAVTSSDAITADDYTSVATFMCAM